MSRNKYPQPVYLSDEEANVLERIADKTGMDCWFWIEQDWDNPGDSSYFFFDLEAAPGTRRKKSFKNALAVFLEGLDHCSCEEDDDFGYKAFGLDDDEITAFEAVVQRTLPKFFEEYMAVKNAVDLAGGTIYSKEEKHE